MQTAPGVQRHARAGLLSHDARRPRHVDDWPLPPSIAIRDSNRESQVDIPLQYSALSLAVLPWAATPSLVHTTLHCVALHGIAHCAVQCTTVQDVA